MQKYWGVELQLLACLNLAVNGAKWLASYHSQFAAKERVLVTHCIEGWVDHQELVWIL
jgi:hypothetical protein